MIRSAEETQQGRDAPETLFALDGGLEAERQIDAGNAWIDVETSRFHRSRADSCPPSSYRRAHDRRSGIGVHSLMSVPPASSSAAVPLADLERVAVAVAEILEREIRDGREAETRPAHVILTNTALGEQQVALAHVFDEAG